MKWVFYKLMTTSFTNQAFPIIGGHNPIPPADRPAYCDIITVDWLYGFSKGTPHRVFDEDRRSAQIFGAFGFKLPPLRDHNGPWRRPSAGPLRPTPAARNAHRGPIERDGKQTHRSGQLAPNRLGE